MQILSRFNAVYADFMQILCCLCRFIIYTDFMRFMQILYSFYADFIQILCCLCRFYADFKQFYADFMLILCRFMQIL